MVGCVGPSGKSLALLCHRCKNDEISRRFLLKKTQRCEVLGGSLH